MRVENFVNVLEADFYTGVPDSLLKPLCDYLLDTHGISSKHIIAANEGNCTAIAAGYHLATRKIPVVYLQNSGLGNIVNPVASLLNDLVYSIPCIFVVGWRGEPGVHDEPQHIYQGKISEKLLENIGLETYIVDKETSEEKLEHKMKEFREKLKSGKSVAFLIKKGALFYPKIESYCNSYQMNREEVLKHIVKRTKEDILVGTTGKLSRELFEIREINGQAHKYDFLTVGSMGHSSSIALGIALNKPNMRVWCLDGDGAVLMHMGALSLIGTLKPQNLIHIVINNSAHESVGGMPTVAENIDWVSLANACGYQNVFSVNDYENLDSALDDAVKSRKLTFIEVKCALGSRSDLGRPTVSAVDNKEEFMDYIGGYN